MLKYAIDLRKKVKQHSDGTEPERTEAGLSNTSGKQQEDDHQYEGPD
jgi:hypothetical protein